MGFCCHLHPQEDFLALEHACFSHHPRSGPRHCVGYTTIVKQRQRKKVDLQSQRAGDEDLTPFSKHVWRFFFNLVLCWASWLEVFSALLQHFFLLSFIWKESTVPDAKLHWNTGCETRHSKYRWSNLLHRCTLDPNSKANADEAGDFLTYKVTECDTELLTFCLQYYPYSKEKIWKSFSVSFVCL